MTAVTCAPLSIPTKAILLTVSCGNTYGSNCAFGCQNGYGSPSGNVTRTCLQSGQWSVNEINCTGTSICSDLIHHTPFAEQLPSQLLSLLNIFINY